MPSAKAQKLIFTIAITGISFALVLRDRLLGRIRRAARASEPDAIATRHTISSGGNLLDAVFVKPASGDALSVLLICHGIGETVEHWLPAQQLLAANGAASLVFDYSGYGRSTGRIAAIQCEEDAVAAFRFLRQQMPSAAISVLGFSLGSGIAAAILPRVEASRLVLGAAFTSFREAACSIAIPRRLAFAVPPLWHAEEALRNCSIPVLIIHGEKDKLFPVEMASRLHAYCGAQAELIVVPKLSHNEPFYRPRLSYWAFILSWLVSDRSAALDLNESAIHLN
jgi:pimeloyl-ACP methyl ester carboxylesterase